MLYGVWLGSTSSRASAIICTAYNSLLLLEDHRDLLSGHPAIVVQFPPYPSTATTALLGANPGERTIIFLALPRAETKFTSRDTLEQVEGKFSAPVMREGGGRPVHDGSAVSSLTPGVTMTLQPRPCSQLYHRWHKCSIGVSAEIK